MSRKLSQLTIRGFDEKLEEKIREVADREGVSLNQAVLRLLRKGAGVDAGPDRDRIGDALDELSGTWTAEQERRFLEALAPFESIDEGLWR